MVILSALPALAYLCLGLIALISSRRHETGGVYSLLCLNLFFLSLIYLYPLLPSVTNHDQQLLTGLSAGWALFPALLLHFSMRISSQQNRTGWIIKSIIYLPVAAFLYRGLETRLLPPSVKTDLLGWISGNEFNDMWRWAFIIYFSIYCVASAMLFLKITKGQSKRSGSIPVFLAVAGVVPVVGFVTASDLILPGFTADYLTTSALMVIFVWLASLRAVTSERGTASLPGLSLEQLSEDILRHADTPYLIANNDGLILHASGSMTGMLGYGDTELEGMEIGRIIVESEPLLSIAAKMRHGVFHTGNSHIHCLTREGQKISVTINCSLVGGAHKDSPGFIVAAPRDIYQKLEKNGVAPNLLSETPVAGETDNPGIEAAKNSFAKDKTPVGTVGGNGDSGFRNLVENALVGIFITRNGRLLYANRKLAEIFGYMQDEISESLYFSELVNESDRKAVADSIDRVMLNGNKSPHFTFRGRRKDGVILDIDAQCTMGEYNGEVAVTGSLYEITELKMMEEAMRHEALHDPLTNLPNRVLFSDRVDMAIAKADREKTMVALMFLDLDRFKGINDAFGHNVGDMLLQSAAGVLRGCLRDSDSVARLGGDEFTILLSSINHEEDAIKVARKILSAVNQKWNLAGHSMHLTTSVGISIYPDDGLDSETLIRKADTAMYSAKAHGGNTFRLYAPFMDAGNAEQMRMENDLRMALDKNELFIQYQPQFDMVTRRISGVEALLRWNHPELGIILPENFIPIAEKTGLIVPIGEWVLTTSCVQARKWHDKGYASLHLAVNVSAIQLKETDFTDMIERVLKKTSFESNRLKLEITESVALQNLDAIVPKLTKLTGLGVQFAIDDFGLGYSSLHYLKRLPIQTIKIDRSFMRDLAKGEEDASIVTAVIAMAKSLKLDTIAEGVETSEQMVFLKKCRCDKMQGFLYSRPLSPGAFESLLRS